MEHDGGVVDGVDLISADGHLVRVETAVARCLGTVVAQAIEDAPGCAIPLLNVGAREMARLLAYARGAAGVSEREEMDAVASSVVAPMRVDGELSELLLSANYVNNAPLLHAASGKVAAAIVGKTAQEIRDMFGLVSDMTPEEEEEVRRENAWAFGQAG